MDQTISYYNNHADQFTEETLTVDMSALYDAFLPHIPEGGHILDAGCGSGRDTRAFLRQGYRVTAFDASAELAARASRICGQNVEHRRFSDIREVAVYDGIWACASLLHLPRTEILTVLNALWQALKPGAVLYFSFKAGATERKVHGRHFTDVDEPQAAEWVRALPDVADSTFWRTADRRPQRTEEWLNGLVHKAPAGTRKLVTGGPRHHFLPHLCAAIHSASDIDLAVAFIKTTGLKLLLPDLQTALTRNGDPARVRIVTSDYLDITDPDALRNLMLLQELGAQIRIFESAGGSFHMKSYIFTGSTPEGRRWGTAFIGSSNISRQALQDGLEWNYRVDFPPDKGFLEALSRYEELFHHPRTQPLSDTWIDAYDSRREPPPQPVAPGSHETEKLPTPTQVQTEALAALEDSRHNGYRRGLVVLATGLGKTWLAAFDAARFGARRILFVAHREEILNQAAETFIRIKPGRRVGYYQGKQRDTAVDILCASIQTLGRKEHLEQFSPQHFDYIVIDEFHHAAAPGYHRLLSHFAPAFLLGLTATPDRTDCADILSLCDDNLVYECNLFAGINSHLLAPFHYYGIYDDTVDYSEIPWRNGHFDPQLLAHKLATLSRSRHVQREWQQRRQKRTLAFCVSRSHADFMAAQFRKQGIAAGSVHGQSELSRGEALEQLEQGRLEIIFSVDLFNEGVDLPAIDTVLLLRPTESKILFLQQIGRGLRKAPGKDKLVVLDFVGNHQSFLHKPQALMGRAMNHRQLASFARAAEEHRLELPDGCFVNFDLQLIDFLKSLDGQGTEKDYQALKETLGRRPTLTEFYHSGASMARMHRQHGHWFALVQSMGDLEEPEQRLQAQHQQFLAHLETTSMSKCFKMILLEAFQELDGWQQPPTAATLAQRSWLILKRRPSLLAELPEAFRESVNNDSQWQSYWAKHPVRAWTGGNSAKERFFRLEEKRMAPTFTVDPDLLQPFAGLVQELIDYRLAAYDARRSTNTLASITPAPKPASDGVELPYFPTLKIACGHFRTSQAEAEEYRQLGPGYGRLDPGRHFIARAMGNSMNGGKQPIRDGDYLLLEQISPSHAGKITGHTLAIECLDEAGDTQYLLRVVDKNSQGQYVLKAKNPDYGDILVTEELSAQFRTFARLTAILDPLEMAVGQTFMREEIPGLFGAEFNPGSWHSGHVFLKEAGAHVLLVTLNKQGNTQNQRYVDHWLDEQRFHWQTQNSTTPESKRGRELIHHRELDLSIHLFVREQKLHNGKAAPFTYYGTMDYQSHEGQKPMNVILKRSG